MKTFLIIAGGKAPTKTTIDYILNLYKPCFIIGADKGCEYILNYGIQPDLLIGDLDSISKKILKKINPEKIIKYPSEKSKTDTQLALKYAIEHESEMIIFTGVTGKRSDHFISNLYLLKFCLEKKIRSLIIDNYMEIELINKKKKIKNKKGMEISLLPFTESVKGLYLKGFKYLPNDNNLFKSNPYSVSNIIISNNAEISIKQGELLIFTLIFSIINKIFK